MPTVSYDTDVYMDPAVPGMPADTGVKDTLSIPCGSPQAFGTVVGVDVATDVSVLPVAGAKGICLYDSGYNGRRLGQEGYVEGDAMSVCQQGRVWALASGPCTKDSPVKYDPATGIVSNTGTATLPRAKFITGDVTIQALIMGGPARRIVQVDLGRPAL